MSTLFSDIYTMFLGDINDDTFLNYPEEDRDIMLDGLRVKAETRFKACKKDLSSKDNDSKCYNSTLTEEEKLIIATAMRKYWLNDKIYNLQLLKQRMSNKDWKMTSQAEHLLRLTVLGQQLDKEISRMIVDYTTYSYSVEK